MESLLGNSMNYRTWNQTFNLLFLKSGFFFKAQCSSNHKGSLRAIIPYLYLTPKPLRLGEPELYIKCHVWDYT